MLGRREFARIVAGFGAFDHEWRLYAPMLGEPFLLDGAFLAYSDGEFVYVCLIPLLGRVAPGSFEEIEGLLSMVPGCHRGVNLWGDFELPPPEIKARGQSLQRIAFSDRDETCCESVVDLSSFDERNDSTAVRAMRAASRRGVTASVRRTHVLTHEHLSLIRRWRVEREIGPVQTEFALTSDRLITQPGVWIVEARRTGVLVGWAVLSMPTPFAVVYLLGFFETGGGSRASDATMAAILGFARARGCRKVFLGYSPTPGLRTFKEKWGGCETGQNYREVFYSCPSHSNYFLTQRFTWRQRLSSHGEGA